MTVSAIDPVIVDVMPMIELHGLIDRKPLSGMKWGSDVQHEPRQGGDWSQEKERPTCCEYSIRPSGEERGVAQVRSTLPGGPSPSNGRYDLGSGTGGKMSPGEDRRSQYQCERQYAHERRE